MTSVRPTRPTLLRGVLTKWRNTDPTSAVFTIALLLWVVAIPAWWIQGGYRGIPVTETFAFSVSDHGCDEDTQGIGRHCFADYYSPLNAMSEGIVLPNGYVAPFNYPPTALIPHLVFDEVAEVMNAGPRAGLLMYLCAGLAAVLAPAMYAMRKVSRQARMIVLLLIGPASLPALLVLDRGNSTVLAVPALLAFGVLSRDRRYHFASICLAVAVSLRPQFVLAYLLLIGLRQWKALVTGALVTVSVLAAGFLVWPGNRIDNFVFWMRGLTSYQEFQSVQDDWPANLSIARAVTHVLQIVGVDASVPGLVGIGFVAVVAITCVVKGRNLDFISLFTLALFSPVLTPDVSFFYYLVVLLPLAAVMFTSPAGMEQTSNWVVGHVLACAVGVSLVPMPFAFGLPVPNITPYFSAIIWSSVCVLLVASAWLPNTFQISGSRRSPQSVRTFVD